MSERIDCRTPELVDYDRKNVSRNNCCKWCGRPLKTNRKGKLVHWRGFRRIWADPRKAGA